MTPWTDFVEVYWGDDFQVVITPVGPRLICAALVSRNPRRRIPRHPAHWKSTRAGMAGSHRPGLNPAGNQLQSRLHINL